MTRDPIRLMRAAVLATIIGAGAACASLVLLIVLLVLGLVR